MRLTYAKRFAGLVVLIAAGLALLWATNVFGWREWRIQEVEGFIGGRLPDESTNVQFATQDQVGRIVWLRFELPASADLNAFLKTLGINESLRENFTPFPAPNRQEAPLHWWQPTQAQVYAGLYHNTGQLIIEVLVDVSSLERQTIYLRAYGIRRS